MIMKGCYDMEITFKDIGSLLIIYLISINLLSFISFGIDKRRAKNKSWRIPESTLFTLTILGGSLGSILGMSFFKHKTKRKNFKIIVPIFLIIHIWLISYLHSFIK